MNKTPTNPYSLSKSAVLTGLGCRKALHMRIHHPERGGSGASLARRLGEQVGEMARRCFPDGILVERDGADDPFELTRRLMQDRRQDVLFEAGFTSASLSVFVDLLQRDGDAWVVTEVKSATGVHQRYIEDLTVQALCLRQCGVRVSRLQLMYIDTDFVYRGDGSYLGLFRTEDLTDRVASHLPAMQRSVAELQALLLDDEPEVYMDGHCRNPHPCPFLSYCRSHDASYPVSSLPNSQGVAPVLRAQGIHDIREIPVELLTSERHRWIRQVVLSGHEALLPAARRTLGALAQPRYYVDFESMQFAIPIWSETRPYEQIPFQWSCHLQTGEDTLLHHEFLDTTGDDPRRRFARNLLDACGEHGPVIVYNQHFEKRILYELAARFPDLSGQLQALSDRIFDLYPVLKQHYYHPEMHGSWSIKSVLPCLVPGLSYEDLGQVKEGTAAQMAYLDLISGRLEEEEWVSLEQDLKDYCARDTLAMVRIVERIAASG